MLEPLAYTVDGSGTFNGIDAGMVWLKAGDWQSKFKLATHRTVIRIAKLEDALRKEDRAYPNSTRGNGATYRKAELDEDNTSGLAIIADLSDNLGERADARDGEDAPMLDTKKLQVNAAESEDDDTDDEYHNDPDTDEDGDEDESGDDDDKDDEEGDENEDEDKEDGETSSDSDIKERKSKKKGKQATKKG
ncbi:hypothetical protein EDB85DRAFT_2146202 [Lactarius pseudohatsudake]|nr:hypothetical protein EDB85DRAFT_2146202 [Lactarius pseudohatsudake]